MPVEVNSDLSVSISEGARRIVSVNCTKDLDADPSGGVGELIATADSITELGYFLGREEDGEKIISPSADLTLANLQVSSVVLLMNNKLVPVGKVFQFTVEGQTAPHVYVVQVTYTTDKVSPIPQVNVVDVLLPCV